MPDGPAAAGRAALPVDSRFQPACAAVWDAHGQLAAQAGDLKVAQVSFTRAVESEPGVATYHFNLGQACLLGGDREQAKTCFKKALKIKPDYAAARNAIAQLNA
jgi:tetratricopeptide (TPR) repeat protein